jgi:hypothetical protein
MSLNALMLIAIAVTFKTMGYCDIYQLITGIDVIQLILNNPAESQAILTTVINTVNALYQQMPVEVFLTDTDLWELLNYAILESGSGDVISAQILRELGLYSNSIIAHLISLGYTIIP